MNKIYVDNKLFMSSTTEYADVANKPMINSVELEGNRTSEELNMYTRTEVDNIIASGRSVLVSETDPPVNPKPNVLYYCKRLNQPMHVILYDSEGTAIDLGDAEGDISSKQDSLPRVVDPATGALKYEIGRNAAGDGWEIVSHTVAGAIKELDTNVQLRQKATDNAILVKDGAGNLVPNVVGALNTLDTKVINLETLVNQRAVAIPKSSQVTRQAMYDKAQEMGGLIVCHAVTWNNSSDNPSGVGNGTSGMLICSRGNVNWGSLLWQAQSTGKLYLNVYANGVVGDWQEVAAYRPLYRWSMDFRLDASKKFGLVEPYFNYRNGYTAAEVWKYYKQIANGNNNDHYQALLVNPLSLTWNDLPSGAVPLSACVLFGSGGDDATITLKIRYFLNGAISDYTYDLGTVGNPTIGTYKPVGIQLL